MSYKGKKLSEEELFWLREKYLKIFNEFNDEHQWLLPFINIMHQSFYESMPTSFLTKIPHYIETELLYKKLKVLSDALLDFHTTIESQ